MNSRFCRFLPVLSVFVAFSVFQVYAAPSVTLSALDPVNAPQQGGQLSGRLTTGGNKAVMVNGVKARSGETIFSGQTIQTPGDTGATVQVPGVGRVDIGPGSKVVNTFDPGRLNVNVISGCVVLTSNAGVAGAVTAKGETRQTDQNAGGVLNQCNDSPAGAAVGSAPQSGGGVGGLGTLGTVLIAVGAVAGAIIIFEVATRNSSPSSSSGR